MREMRNAYKILVRKPGENRPHRRPRSRWEDIRMDLRKIGWECVDWTHPCLDRDQWLALTNMVMNLWVP
jgi:hypothetical protein